MKYQNLLQDIGKALQHMRRSECKVADYVLAHPDDVIHMRIVDLAQEAKVSEPTVVRFCRAIGCDGFQDFKLGLAQQLAAKPGFTQFQVQPDDSVGEYCHKIFDATSQTLDRVRETLDMPQLELAVSALSRARRISFCGFGASSSVASDAQHKFFRLGLSATVHVDAHIQTMAALSLSPGDVFVAISQTGRTRSLIDTMDLARQHGGIVIALCPSGTPIATHATIPICIDVDEDTEFYTSQSSRIAQLVVIDVLALGVSHIGGPKITEHLQRLKQGLAPLRMSASARPGINKS